MLKMRYARWGVCAAGAGWVLPALLIVFVSTFTTTFLDIYSNSVSVLSICPKLNERKVSLVCGLLGTALALVFTIWRLLERKHPARAGEQAS